MEVWELDQQFIEGEKWIKRVMSSLEQKDHKQALGYCQLTEYLINDHRFINTLIERMGTFSEGDDLNKFLTKFKTTAWELVPYWRERNTEAALFREL